jgi:hypothetical protein
MIVIENSYIVRQDGCHYRIFRKDKETFLIIINSEELLELDEKSTIDYFKNFIDKHKLRVL